MAPVTLAYIVSEDWYFRSHRLPVAVAALEAGFKVHLIARLSTAAKSIQELGIQTHDFNIGRGAIDLRNHNGTIRCISGLLATIQPDVLHNVAMKPVIYGSLAASQLRTPPAVVNALGGLGHLFTSNSFRAKVLRQAAQIALRKALSANHGALILQNDDDRNLLQKRRVVQASKVRMIRGSGVDTEQFAPIPRTDRTPVVAFVARFLREKGLFEFIDAVKILRSRGSRARFVLIGGPDPDNPSSIDLNSIRTKAAGASLELWGWRSDMSKTLNDVDIMVLPSYREGLPKSLIEAASAGLPIVTTDAPGCRDVVEHGSNGFLVPVHAVEPLASAIEELVEDPELRVRFGLASRERAEAHYSITDVVQQTVRLYGELAADLGRM